MPDAGGEAAAAWEPAHRQAYREGSWKRVGRLAWALTKRHIGYDPGDVEAIEENGGSSVEDPEKSQQRLVRWMPAAQLLALALWRAARDADVLVEAVPLERALWWLGGARHNDLYADPLPAWPSGLPGRWGRTRGREDLMESARQVVTWHLMQDRAENLALADTEDGTDDVPLLLGDRCRALASGPYRDGHKARWVDSVHFATRDVGWASAELRAGLWRPGSQALHAAQALHPSLAAAPDAPALPKEITGVAWIQRVVRLAHLRSAIETVQDHHGRADELDPHPARPFGSALASVACALSQIDATARDLEVLWAVRETGVALWERAHLPIPIREHIIALEEVVAAASGLCFDMIHFGEPH
ncbi:hypothetical protein [Streptomyces goshikiensis]|uniref:hypothetical protein n=1 Tax=Streptomyces goshikiensis TaxID=1942 RepID=UPI0036B90E6A